MNLYQLKADWLGNVRGDCLAGIVVALTLILEGPDFTTDLFVTCPARSRPGNGLTRSPAARGVDRDCKRPGRGAVPGSADAAPLSERHNPAQMCVFSGFCNWNRVSGLLLSTASAGDVRV